MSHIQRIKNQLELRNKREAAVKAVLSGKKDVKAAAISYGVNQKILDRKLNILKGLDKHYELKSKFESAVKEYLAGGATIKAAANHYGISQIILTKEIEHFMKENDIRRTSYKYSRSIERTAIFTIREEVLLIKDLFFWKKIFQPYCFCQLCAMEQLLILASQYARNRGRVYLEERNKTKLVEWLTKLEMRLSNFVSRNFISNCIKVPTKTQTLENKSKSSLLLVSKSVYDNDLQKKNFDQLQIRNVKDKSTQTDREITSIVAENDQPMDLRIKQKR
ncbi:uncharacterized protein [Polyergus mexicanus]|uniref:uncharacterized protein n=1 Tax=Polyergus mexicanus TaxID=615972 RepID=UPI0038B54626